MKNDLNDEMMIMKTQCRTFSIQIHCEVMSNLTYAMKREVLKTSQRGKKTQSLVACSFSHIVIKSNSSGGGPVVCEWHRIQKHVNVAGQDFHESKFCILKDVDKSFAA